MASARMQPRHSAAGAAPTHARHRNSTPSTCAPAGARHTTRVRLIAAFQKDALCHLVRMQQGPRGGGQRGRLRSRHLSRHSLDECGEITRLMCAQSRKPTMAAEWSFSHVAGNGLAPLTLVRRDGDAVVAEDFIDALEVPTPSSSVVRVSRVYARQLRGGSVSAHSAGARLAGTFDRRSRRIEVRTGHTHLQGAALALRAC
jgi:hypothetical protein